MSVLVREVVAFDADGRVAAEGHERLRWRARDVRPFVEHVTHHQRFWPWLCSKTGAMRIQVSAAPPFLRSALRAIEGADRHSDAPSVARGHRRRTR